MPSLPAIPVGGTAASAPSPDAPAAVQASSRPPPAESLEQVAEQLNALFQARKQALEFSVDRSSDQVIVILRDTATGEVVRQYPSPEMLVMARTMDRLGLPRGQLLDRDA